MSTITRKFFDENFKYVSDLGQGSYGTVKKYMYTPNCRFYALKQVRCLANDSDSLNSALSEIMNLVRLEHVENVVTLKYYYLDGKQSPQGYIQQLNMVLECGDKSLDKEIDFNARHNLKYDSSVFAQVLFGMIKTLAYLQKQQIAHRDIKPGNIIVFGREYKLTDFGLCILKEHSVSDTQIVAGTPAYMDPFLYDIDQKYRKMQRKPVIPKYNVYKADVFSLGLTILEMFTLNRQVGLNSRALNGHVKIHQYLQSMDRSNDLSNQVYRILRIMLEYDIHKRPDFIDLEKQIENFERNQKMSIQSLTPSMENSITASLSDGQQQIQQQQQQQQQPQSYSNYMRPQQQQQVQQQKPVKDYYQLFPKPKALQKKNSDKLGIKRVNSVVQKTSSFEQYNSDMNSQQQQQQNKLQSLQSTQEMVDNQYQFDFSQQQSQVLSQSNQEGLFNINNQNNNMFQLNNQNNNSSTMQVSENSPQSNFAISQEHPNQSQAQSQMSEISQELNIDQQHHQLQLQQQQQQQIYEQQLQQPQHSYLDIFQQQQSFNQDEKLQEILDFQTPSQLQTKQPQQLNFLNSDQMMAPNSQSLFFHMDRQLNLASQSQQLQQSADETNILANKQMAVSQQLEGHNIPVSIFHNCQEQFSFKLCLPCIDNILSVKKIDDKYALETDTHCHCNTCSKIFPQCKCLCQTCSEQFKSAYCEGYINNACKTCGDLLESYQHEFWGKKHFQVVKTYLTVQNKECLQLYSSIDFLIPVENYIIAGNHNGKITILDKNNMSLLDSITFHKKLVYDIISIKSNNIPRYMLVSDMEQIAIYDFQVEEVKKNDDGDEDDESKKPRDFKKPKHLFITNSSVISFDYNHRYNILITCNRENSIIIYKNIIPEKNNANPDDPQFEIFTSIEKAHRYPIRNVQFVNSEQFVSADKMGNIILWSFENKPKILKEVSLNQKINKINYIFEFDILSVCSFDSKAIILQDFSKNVSSQIVQIKTNSFVSQILNQNNQLAILAHDNQLIINDANSLDVPRQEESEKNKIVEFDGSLYDCYIDVPIKDIVIGQTQDSLRDKVYKLSGFSSILMDKEYIYLGSSCGQVVKVCLQDQQQQ